MDLSSQGFGTPWEQGGDWTNFSSYAPANYNGNGWEDPHLPFLVDVYGNGSSIAVITSGSDGRYFDLNGSTYVEREFMQDTLVHNTSTNEFVLTDSAGNQTRFSDFSTSLPTGQRGQFDSLTDPYGTVTSVTSRNSTGLPTEVQRSLTSGSTTYTESYLYGYVASGVNAGLLQSVTLRRQVNSGSWTTVRQVQYTYYDGTESYGNTGDLMTAVVEDASGNALDTSYYRYYTSSDAGSVGYVHGLKYAFGPDAYARLVAAVGTPTTATDSQVAPYADEAYQYNPSNQRVTQVVLAGSGGSSTGGQGTYTYSYTAGSNSPGYNSWAEKTVETLPDNNQNIVYTNAYGEVMLSVYHDTTSGLSWDTFYKYDSQGRILWQANPSAVTGYNDTYADLLNYQSGSYQYLSNNSGLITVNDYYSSTTAGETTAGGVQGYQQDVKVQQGQSGTAILQSQTQYYAHTAGGVTVAPVATQTAYRNTDGTGGETTSYSYTWFSGTTQMQSETVSKPVISSSQNGPGSADTRDHLF